MELTEAASDPASAKTTTSRATDSLPEFALGTEQVLARLSTDAAGGLSAQEAADRLTTYGPNRIVAQKPPTLLSLILRQLGEGMTLMLIVVTVGGILIGQFGLSVVVGLLVLTNVTMSVRQAVSARASIDGLATAQVPLVRVMRDGSLALVPAPDLVPGDIVRVEAGDIVPADGRLLDVANLETQEAALTGESASVAKTAAVLEDQDAALGDRRNMLFQNTIVARGTGTFVVTATGTSTQVGLIATMLDEVEAAPSPLQRELGALTRIIVIVAWVAVAVLLVLGLLRGLSLENLVLLGVAVAVSAIPSGLPTFVQALLAYGARTLAEHGAVVKNLADVETLGATSAINSDKTGTLTLNEMVVTEIYTDGCRYHVEGNGYAKTGSVLGIAGATPVDFTRMAYALCLASDATVSDSGAVIGDPTEAAMVVLAAKLGVDAESTRQVYPRLAEVPFDSEYKFMATLHRLPLDDGDLLTGIVKGAPDVVLARCTASYAPNGDVTPIADCRADIEAANQDLAARGLRVIALAVRVYDDSEEASVIADPMAAVSDLLFVGLLGIIDPLRPEAKAAVAEAQAAGITVRMITGDHAVTAQAIGADLGLRPGAMTGPEFRALSDAEIVERLPTLNILGRSAPQDKLRLVQIMQSQGQVVAMTGDAVNDAAAIKAASVGVAMGSGSEVTKQAARMILTDDNFGTLVRAVRLGRDIYDKIVCYVRYQMTQLVALLALFITVSVLGVADGVALTPGMTLLVNFFIATASVLTIMFDVPSTDAMRRPPRDPKVSITSRSAVVRWVVYGGIVFLAALTPLLLGPDTPSDEHATTSMTMCFAVMGLATAFSGIVMRRDREPALAAPAGQALLILAAPLLLLLLATELPLMQQSLMTTSLTGEQWLACLGLALTMPVVVEVDSIPS